MFLTFSFPVWIHFISFSCLIVVAGTSSKILNRSENAHPYLVPNLKESPCSVSLRYYVSLRLFTDVLYPVEEISL